MCRNGPVSSSRTGSTPRTRGDHPPLAGRAGPGTATCVMPGMVTMISSVLVGRGRDASVVDADHNRRSSISSRAPGEQAGPAAAQPQGVQQLDDEPGAGRALRVTVDQAAPVGVHPVQGDAGLL